MTIAIIIFIIALLVAVASWHDMNNHQDSGSLGVLIIFFLPSCLIALIALIVIICILIFSPTFKEEYNEQDRREIYSHQYE